MSPNDRHDLGCGVCLGFGYLPGIGPCPTCRPAGHLAFVCAVVTKALGHAAPEDAKAERRGGEAA